MCPFVPGCAGGRVLLQGCESGLEDVRVGPGWEKGDGRSSSVAPHSLT